MLRGHHNILILILIALLMAIPPPADAQGDDVGGTGTQPDGRTTSPIMFDSGEDASLFVGYYRLNPGDTIQVEIITDVTRSYQAMIDDEGYIAIPVLGRVRIADLTVSETRVTLQELADEYYLRAWVTCQVVMLGKVKFYVYGDVDVPGFYTASGATTFFDFLQKFDIASDTEHRRIVHVRGERSSALPEPVDLLGNTAEPSTALIDEALDLFRANKPDEINPAITIVDPMDFTLEGEIEQRNFYLEYGDVIYIPDPEVLVSLQGFRRPGPYEVLPGENWSDLVRMAGAPDILNDITNLVLERYDRDGKLTQIYYNLNLLDNDELGRIPVLDRDRLTSTRHDGNVYVLGEVNEAGSFNYLPGMTPLEYLAMAAGPTPDAHLRFAVIVRPPHDPSVPMEESEIFEVDLVEAVTSGAPAASIPMQPGDILFIPDTGEQLSFSTILSGLSVLTNAIRLFD